MSPREGEDGLFDRIEELANWKIRIIPLIGPMMDGSRWFVSGINCPTYVPTFREGLEAAEAFMLERRMDITEQAQHEP